MKTLLIVESWFGNTRLIAGAVAGGAAVGLERVAYRPLRKRGAPSLVFLITAIGASFVIQEFVHFVLPKLTGGTLGGVNAQQPIRLVEASDVLTFGNASISNVEIVIVVSALTLAFAADVFINRTKFGRGIRAGQRGDVPGQGIGLAVVREIVALYRGTVAISRSILGGAEIRLQL